jgi:ABC-type transport system involved in cytochrome c biogenesis permease component
LIPRGIGLLLRRELARLDRAPGRRRIVRALSLCGLGLVFMMAQAGGPTVPFLALAWSQLILLSFLQPVRAAGIFVEGRLDGTLSLLALTPLRPWAVALGTCLAALALAAEGILVSLPLFAIAGVYADLAVLDMARVAATILAGAFLSTCVGAAVGAKGGGRQAVSSGFMQALVWMFLLFVISLVVFNVCENISDPAIAPYAKPFGRVIFLPSGLLLGVEEGLYAPLCSFVFGLGVLGVASLRTSRAIRDEETSRGGGGGWRALLPSKAEGQPTAPAPSRSRVPVPDRRVVAWREARRQGAGGCFRPGWIAIAAVLFVFGSGILGGLVNGDYQVAVYSGLMLGSTLWLLLFAWGLMGGARAYVEDREDGTLELLLTTPHYDPWTLVKEKLRGALERGRWGIFAGCMVHTSAVLGLGLLHGHGVLSILMAVSSILVVWIAGAWVSLSVGQSYSLRAPSAARAQTWAAATAGIVFFVGLFSTCFISAIWIIPSVDTVPWVAGAIHYGLSLVLGIVALGFVYGLRQNLTWRVIS